ncbi:hypothetical protein Pmani_027634 [Petrolisthes manimaculis]|uniref:Sec20 C-terminal domain-containing protein n=1 Tax=Petrolisthes manimaculis TaxID=1843537 RepID=A0AAE1P3N7_9EUCA|nr:hypothetical protein Pmani_027634 [Petrolisthes manimaculis]
MDEEEDVYLSVIRQDIVKYDMLIKSLIQEIREHTGGQGELDNIGVLVRSRITQLRDQIEELKRLAQEGDSENVCQCLQEEAARSDKVLHDNHKAFRYALLVSQMAINQRSRDDLITTNTNNNTTTTTTTGEGDGDETDNNSSSSGSTVRKRQSHPLHQHQHMSRELLVKNSTQVTDDLLTVTRLIRDNTEKSAKTVDRLVDGSQTITATQEELKTMDSVIGQAGKILSKYGRRENTDKLLIFLGLVFFMAACLVVMRNRFPLFF